jgi:hypothetical protein
MRGILCATVMLASVSIAQAETVTLACSGTAHIDDGKVNIDNEPRSGGVILNLEAKTVQTSSLFQVPQATRIITVTSADVHFYGEQTTPPTQTTSRITYSLNGDFDRITGDLTALAQTTTSDGRVGMSGESVFLKCRPVRRVF